MRQTPPNVPETVSQSALLTSLNSRRIRYWYIADESSILGSFEKVDIRFLVINYKLQQKI
jgi:hypothetical protein